MEHDLGAAAEGLAGGVGADGEGAAGRALPDVLLVVVVLGGDEEYLLIYLYSYIIYI